jgi:hypothetical protein
METTTTMPRTNHTQPDANAKIIGELFPSSPESAETAPLELSQQQMQTLLHIALATIRSAGSICSTSSNFTKPNLRTVNPRPRALCG